MRKKLSVSDVINKLLAEFKVASPKKKLQMAKDHGYETSAEFLEALEQAIKREEAEDDIVGETTMTDMVVAFDTTGSMGIYIDAVKKHVKEIVPKMFKDIPDLRMKIVAFGDYCDMPSKDVFGNAYQESDLTNDQNKLIDFVNNAQNTSGGDIDEFYELVIHKIVTETPWREGSKKSVLLIADCMPHEIGYTIRTRDGKEVGKNQINWVREAQKAAEKGIQFDTLRIIPGTEWYAQLSQMTGGACMDFRSSEKVHQVMTAATYARGSHKEFATAYYSAVRSGDEELVGAMKSMVTDTVNFAPEEKMRMFSEEKKIREEKETKK